MQRGLNKHDYEIDVVEEILPLQRVSVMLSWTLNAVTMISQHFVLIVIAHPAAFHYRQRDSHLLVRVVVKSGSLGV